MVKKKKGKIVAFDSLQCNLHSKCVFVTGWLALHHRERKFPVNIFLKNHLKSLLIEKKKITITIKKNEDFLISIGEIKLVYISSGRQ